MQKMTRRFGGSKTPPSLEPRSRRPVEYRLGYSAVVAGGITIAVRGVFLCLRGFLNQTNGENSAVRAPATSRDTLGVIGGSETIDSGKYSVIGGSGSFVSAIRLHQHHRTLGSDDSGRNNYLTGLGATIGRFYNRARNSFATIAGRAVHRVDSNSAQGLDLSSVGGITPRMANYSDRRRRR
jgi:hypothetical protein